MAMSMDPSDPAVMSMLQQAFQEQMLAVNGVMPAQKIDNEILNTVKRSKRPLP